MLESEGGQHEQTTAAFFVWQALLARNCITVLGAVHHFGRRMVERGRGGIALVGSGAGWAGGSHLAVYGA